MTEPDRRRFRWRRSVRTTVLSVALVPGLVLTGVTAAVATRQISRALDDRAWANEARTATPAGTEFLTAILIERGLTLRLIAGQPIDRAELDRQRARLDRNAAIAVETMTRMQDIAPGSLDDVLAAFGSFGAVLPEVRKHVDAGNQDLIEAYRAYNRIADASAAGIDAIVRRVPSAEQALAATTATMLYRAADRMTAAHVLAQTATETGALPGPLLAEFARDVGGYHTQLDIVRGAIGFDRTELDRLTTGADWQLLERVEGALLRAGSAENSETSGRSATDRRPGATGEADWEAAAARIGNQLVAIWGQRYATAQNAVAVSAENELRAALVASLVAIVLAAAILAGAVRVSSQLVRRLGRLHRQTLAIAEQRLPAVIDAAREHRPVEAGAEQAGLDFGADEIGQVAAAFNQAYDAAVQAALTEASTRSAVNVVFLNIARRSQSMMHRQLAVLDRAEAQEEDPGLLELLFQLDHLATRERRNAENLIILGGGRPGRQWRQPVPLNDVVRSAIGETQDYTRVRVSRLPDIQVAGAVIADTVHLLAELVDNATSFSPPSTTVDVTGAIVGKGVTVEIADRGLGMRAPELAEANRLLASQMDLSTLTVSGESRVGLVVVAVLAARNGIRVRLAESEYGGIRAIVVIPSAVLTEDTAPAPQAHRTVDDAGPPPAPRPRDLRYAPDERPSHVGSAERPALPRRERGRAMAPELETTAPPTPHPTSAAPHSPETASSLIGAVTRGTRRGRHSAIDPIPYPDYRGQQ
ncbi:nitrate- and nitrite sensing domain-containing protein [Nocardia sp. NPDC057227]|uniref:sensor histidine kinase n=1 Tax=Nocardia sp. NPDC057227 TaxID=3346056 RepID=UPI00362AAE78